MVSHKGQIPPQHIKNIKKYRKEDSLFYPLIKNHCEHIIKTFNHAFQVALNMSLDFNISIQDIELLWTKNYTEAKLIYKNKIHDDVVMVVNGVRYYKKYDGTMAI